MVYVFVIKLENNKYFVGKTVINNFKLNQLDSLYKPPVSRPDWYVIHKPIEIIEMIPNCTEQDVDKYTYKYMKKYGISNVRGGSYPSSYIDKETRAYIEKFIAKKFLSL